jgi:hypothetical protein
MTLKYCTGEVQALVRLFYCMEWRCAKQEREFISLSIDLKQFQRTFGIAHFKFTALKLFQK